MDWVKSRVNWGAGEKNNRSVPIHRQRPYNLLQIFELQNLNVNSMHHKIREKDFKFKE